MDNHGIAHGARDTLTSHAGRRFEGAALWSSFLDELGISASRACLVATEGARLGCLFAHGPLREDSAILSDDAGQFDLGLRQFLCWVHAERRFERTFRTGTSYRLLDEQIERTLANRNKLLAVLDRPDVPLHNNQLDNDPRSYVTRRKISAGTRPDAGRACRDAFHTHMKTCARHGISFWNYLGDRVPWLPDLARPIPRSAPLPAQ